VTRKSGTAQSASFAGMVGASVVGGRAGGETKSSPNPAEDEFKEHRWKKESINTQKLQKS